MINITEMRKERRTITSIMQNIERKEKILQTIKIITASITAFILLACCFPHDVGILGLMTANIFTSLFGNSMRWMYIAGLVLIEALYVLHDAQIKKLQNKIISLFAWLISLSITFSGIFDTGLVGSLINHFIVTVIGIIPLIVVSIITTMYFSIEWFGIKLENIQKVLLS
ncbi:MAG: hypothetical protein FWC41_00400 [Firmicutes bacterium]|nr:hypothetical protein [Bacillota bacterium]